MSAAVNCQLAIALGENEVITFPPVLTGAKYVPTVPVGDTPRKASCIVNWLDAL